MLGLSFEKISISIDSLLRKLVVYILVDGIENTLIGFVNLY